MTKEINGSVVSMHMYKTTQKGNINVCSSIGCITLQEIASFTREYKYCIEHLVNQS